MKSEEITLKEFAQKIVEWKRYLLSKWLVILIFGLTGGALGLAYSVYQKPSYSAITTFVMEDGDSSGGLGQISGLASIIGMDNGSRGGIFQGDNIVELYKSRTMIQKALLTPVKDDGKDVLLVDAYIHFNDLKKDWNKNPKLSSLTFQKYQEGVSLSRLQDSVLGAIVKDINKNYLEVGKSDKKLSIIKAETKAEDEFFAKAFNEQIVKQVNDFYVQTKTKKGVDNVKIIQDKVDSVRTIMTGSIYSAIEATDATPNINLTRTFKRNAPIQRSQISIETNKLVLGELLKNLELSKISLQKDAPLIQVIDVPVFPLDKTKLSKSGGIIRGGFLFGFLTVVFLLVSKLIRELLQS